MSRFRDITILKYGSRNPAKAIASVANESVGRGEIVIYAAAEKSEGDIDSPFGFHVHLVIDTQHKS